MCHVDPALFGTGYSGKTEAEKARSVLDNYPHIRMVAHANVLKQRNGAIGPAHLAFVEKYTRFAELDTRNFTVLPFDAAAMN